MSTMPYRVPHFTVAVDPGPAHTAVGARRGRAMLNCGVFAPRRGGPLRMADVADPDRELWEPSGEVADLANLTQRDLMLSLVLRVTLAYDWMVRTYADPDEPVYGVVEMSSFVPRGRSAVPTMLTREIGQLCAQALDCEVFYTRPRLVLGERHRRAKGGPYPVEDCYPDGIHDEWAVEGAPGRDGQPVRMLPNEDRGKRGTAEKVLRRKCRDAQAVYDIGAAYWMDDHELQALVEGRPLAEVMM